MRCMAVHDLPYMRVRREEAGDRKPDGQDDRSDDKDATKRVRELDHAGRFMSAERRISPASGRLKGALQGAWLLH